MFILKSRSPRRIEILKNLGIMFRVDPSDIDESQKNNEPPLDYLKRIVEEKIGKDYLVSKSNLYLSCDTIVVQNEEILHKPTDEGDAFAILSKLNGKEHSVFSGCILYAQDEMDFFYEETRIQFKKWNENQIREYISRCLPLDKAGAYGIQDPGTPVLKWEGSYQNVMGFPVRGFLSRWQNWISAWS